jgi:hypothetical protein
MLQTPEHIQLFQLCALRTGLVLEIKGLKKTGRSCYAILKGMGYRGNRERVLEAVKADIAAQFKEFGIV